MKKILTLCMSLVLVSSIYGQFKIETGATVTFTGNATLVLQDVDLINEGTINEGTSTIKFKGAADSEITSGGATLYNLEIDKDPGFNVTTKDNTEVSNQLTFSNTNNKLETGNFDLTLQSGATISGASSDNFIVTNGTGEVIKESLSSTSFQYPVGFDASSYNPVTITENGTSDDIGVRVLENAYDDGTSSGVQITEEVVNATWVVSEGTAGGADLDVTAQWNASDETADLDNTLVGVARYDGSAYDLTLANSSTATGSDPYTQSRTGLEAGSLIIAGDANFAKVAIDPVVLLEGPLSGGLMNDGIRSLNFIPAAEPYTGLGFMHEGLGGGEVVANPAAVFGVTGNDAIVDWVFVELRDASDATNVVATRSALIQRDGDIVDVDGTSSLEFSGFAADNYFVAVRHRLHLGFRSSSTLSLSAVASAANFADGTVGTFGTDALKNISGSFAMYSGNGNYDGSINSVDKNSQWIPQNGQTYNYTTSSADFNLDAAVNAVDLNLHWNVNNGKIEQLD